MKSSTLHRSNLSKEKIAFLESLRSSKSTTKVVSSKEAVPNVYVRPRKDKDLDVLWQSFKVNQKEEKSPGVYLTIGFITGALVTLLVVAVLSIASNISLPTNVEPKPERKTRFGKPIFNIASKPKADKVQAVATEPVVKNETYMVKTGDTLAGIVVRFYGKYDLEKVDKVLKANNLSNPNRIAIGQNLVIPMD